MGNRFRVVVSCAGQKSARPVFRVYTLVRGTENNRVDRVPLRIDPHVGKVSHNGLVDRPALPFQLRQYTHSVGQVDVADSGGPMQRGRPAGTTVKV